MPRQTRRSIYKTPPSTTPKTRSKKTKEKTEIEESFVIDSTPSENINEINQEEENNDENEKQIEKTVEQDSSSDDDDDEDQKDETEISKNIQQIAENDEETFVIDSNPCQNVQKNEESENEVPNDIDSSENDSSSDDEDDKLQEKNLNISKKSDSDGKSQFLKILLRFIQLYLLIIIFVSIISQMNQKMKIYPRNNYFALVPNQH